jgi:hypothetical protein
MSIYIYIRLEPPQSGVIGTWHPTGTRHWTFDMLYDIIYYVLLLDVWMSVMLCVMSNVIHEGILSYSRLGTGLPTGTRCVSKESMCCITIWHMTVIMMNQFDVCVA